MSPLERMGMRRVAEGRWVVKYAKKRVRYTPPDSGSTARDESSADSQSECARGGGVTQHVTPCSSLHPTRGDVPCSGLSHSGERWDATSAHTRSMDKPIASYCRPQHAAVRRQGIAYGQSLP